jgi:hypothetical protein
MGVVEASEELYGELNEMLDRPLKGRQKVDQPRPDDDLPPRLRGKSGRGADKSLNFGAGNETRTRDPDLGKTPGSR